METVRLLSAHSVQEIACPPLSGTPLHPTPGTTFDGIRVYNNTFVVAGLGEVNPPQANYFGDETPLTPAIGMRQPR